MWEFASFEIKRGSNSTFIKGSTSKRCSRNLGKHKQNWFAHQLIRTSGCKRKMVLANRLIRPCTSPSLGAYFMLQSQLVRTLPKQWE